jgi:hypothetical protein
MSKEDLLGMLREIVAGVESGDTLEGSIEFLLPYEGDPQDADFMVQASYRVGNRMGQGSIRMFGDMVEVPE